MKLMKLLRCGVLTLTVLAVSAPAVCQEAGYAIHVDWRTKRATQCVIAPIETIRAVRVMGLSIGDLDLSAVVAARTNVSLGVGVGKSGWIGDPASGWRWSLGVSGLDRGQERVQIDWGVFFGVSKRL